MSIKNFHLYKSALVLLFIYCIANPFYDPFIHVAIFKNRGTFFVNGDFELGMLNPFTISNTHKENEFILVSDSSLSRNGKYCAQVTLSAANLMSNQPIRRRAELKYSPPLMVPWEKGYDEFDGSELWYAISFKIDKLPDDSAQVSKFSILQLAAPTPSLYIDPITKRRKQHQDVPVVALRLVRDNNTGKGWHLWTFQAVYLKGRESSFSPEPIEDSTWYDVILRVKWEENSYLWFYPNQKAFLNNGNGSTGAAEIEAKIKKADEKYFKGFCENENQPYNSNSITFNMYDGVNDGVVKGGHSIHKEDFGKGPTRRCYLKFGVYGNKLMKADEEISIFFDDIKVYKSAPLGLK